MLRLSSERPQAASNRHNRLHGTDDNLHGYRDCVLVSIGMELLLIMPAGDRLVFALPYPPSVNTYWRHRVIGKRASVYISEKGQDYRKAVKALISIQDQLTGLLHVSIRLTPPDKRVRDIDNPIKALLDSLTHAGLWVDDSQVKRLSIEMLGKGQGGALVTVMEYQGEI